MKKHRKAGNPGGTLQGVRAPKVGSTAPTGARLSTPGAQASAGEKGRAYDSNCDKYRSRRNNP